MRAAAAYPQPSRSALITMTGAGLCGYAAWKLYGMNLAGHELAGYGSLIAGVMAGKYGL